MVQALVATQLDSTGNSNETTATCIQKTHLLIFVFCLFRVGINKRPRVSTVVVFLTPRAPPISMLMVRLGVFFRGINKRPFLTKRVLAQIDFNIEIGGCGGIQDELPIIGAGVYLSRPGINKNPQNNFVHTHRAFRFFKFP